MCLLTQLLTRIKYTEELNICLNKLETINTNSRMQDMVKIQEGGTLREIGTKENVMIRGQ